MSGYRSYRPPRGRHARSRQQHSDGFIDDNVDVLNDETFGDCGLSSSCGSWEDTHRRFAELDLKSRGLDTSSLDASSDDQRQSFDVERALSKLVDDDEERAGQQERAGQHDIQKRQQALESILSPLSGLLPTSYPAASSEESFSSALSGTMGSFSTAGPSEQPQSLLHQIQSTQSPQVMTGAGFPPGMSGKVLTVEELEQSFTSQDKGDGSVAGHTSDDILAQLLSPVGRQQTLPIGTRQASPAVSQQMVAAASHSLPPPHHQGVAAPPRPLLPTAPITSFPQHIPHMPVPMRGPALLPQMLMPRPPFPGQLPPGIPPRLARQFAQLMGPPRFPPGAHGQLPPQLPPHFTQLPPGMPPLPMPGIQGMPWLHFRGQVPVPFPIMPGMVINDQGSPVLGGEQQRSREPYPREIEFSTATEEDPFAGLMTQKEKDYIIKIQMLQLQSQNPFADDYYYQMMTMKRREQELRRKAEENDGECGDGERDKETKIIIPNVKFEVREYRPPVDSEGSLGKITVGSIASPRKMLDISTAVDTQMVKLDAHPSLRRKLLIVLEKIYGLLLQIDELKRRAMALPEADRNPLFEAALQNRQKFVELIGIESSDVSSCYQQDIDFIHLMSIRKGRTLIGRLLQVLSPQQAEMLLIKVFSHIVHILKRDLQDLPSALVPGISSVTSSIRSTSLEVVVHIMSSVVASEDVVCEFIAHVVEATGSRASELLFENPANVDKWSDCCTTFCDHVGPLIVSKQSHTASRLLAKFLISHPYIPTTWQTAFRQLASAT